MGKRATPFIIMGVKISGRSWVVVFGLVILLILPGYILGDTQDGADSTGRLRSSNADIEPNDDINSASLVQFISSIQINGSLSPIDTVDWYKFQVTKGNSVGNGATRFAIVLSDISTGPGVYMELFGDNSKPPYPHKLASSVVHNAANPNPNATPGIFDMVSPHDGYMYIKVIPNSVADGNYTLNFNKKTEDNLGYDGDNMFPDATWVDVLTGTYLTNVYLDPKWDVHDFYNFTGYENQTVEITLTCPSTADYDIYLFDKQTTTYIASGTLFGFGVGDRIVYKLTENGTYYVRVAAKIDGSINHDNNFGLYSIDFKGNVPPLWRPGAKDNYTMLEDELPIYIELELLWKDLNKNDELEFLLWNQSRNGGGGDWEPRDESSQIISTVYYDNFKIEITNNGTITLPDEEIRITPLPNKNGITEVKLGARDIPLTYSEHNITITILPVNDPPVINNTIKWKRFLPDMLNVKNNKIIVNEENPVKIQVTAYDIEDDNLTFSDDTDLFDIDPDTGLISFYANYTLIGKYLVNIIVTDDGSNPDELSTSLTLTIDIRSSGIDHRPKTNLLSPENNSITKSLSPTLIWNGTDIDSEQSELTYTLYLSIIKEKISSLDNDAKIIEGINSTSYTFSDPPLNDQTWYYWTVIPNDGIFTGICIDDFYKFKIDASVISPEVVLVSPANRSILNTTDIELKWNKIYDGTDVVTYDLYLGISAEELKLQKQDYRETSYLLNSLANDHTYYWKVVPKAGVPPNRITGKESPIFSFSIDKIYKPPTVELISPDDRSIFKTKEISLSWKVINKDPKNVDYELYISTSDLFGTTPEAELSETFYKFTAPEDIKYYWKVVPFINDIPGLESEVRWFKIDPNVIQPLVIPNYPKNNQTLNVTYVELQWSLEYSGAKSKVRYDVYLDNTTSYRPGMTQIQNNYKQFFLPVVLDDYITYYWYVIPTIETDEGFIIGEFQYNISSFTVDISYIPPPEPDFNISLNRSYIEIESGKSALVGIIIRNNGNVPLTIALSYRAMPSDILFIELLTRRITLAPGETNTITLGVTVSPQAEPNGSVTITIQGEADKLGLTERNIISIRVIPDGEVIKPDDGRGGISGWQNLLVLLIVTILILISLFIYSTLKRHKLLNHQRREMIFGYVKENPGEHFRGIQKALGLEVGVLAHHINKLEREEFVKSRQDGQYRRFYPMDAKIDVKLILSKIQENILNWIKKNPGISGSTLATQIGVDRKLVTYHVNVLQNAGFIYTEKEGRDKICFSAIG